MLLSTCFDLCSYGLVWIERKRPFFIFVKKKTCIYERIGCFTSAHRVQRIKRRGEGGERRNHKL
jgi:hypothetical protein